MGKLLKKIDSILLLIISVFAIIFTVVDTFNININNPIFADINYSVLSVVLLAAIGLHLIVARFQDDSSEDARKADTIKIITSLDGVQIELLASTREMEIYLAKRILEAKKEICDLSWKNTLSRTYSTNPRQKSMKTVENSIKQVSDNLPYREVFVFSDVRRKEKLQARLKENKSGYSCRYYDENSKIPRLQFVLIDEEEIIFASSSYPVLCAIKHPHLARIFQSYYDDVWEKAIPIKEGPILYRDSIDKIMGS